MNKKPKLRDKELRDRANKIIAKEKIKYVQSESTVRSITPPVLLATGGAF